ncbi:TonB-dependent receptor [methane-oxidizing endosymbiont of Gigantopelta aegis]|uniref:TonB-dependent receptor n=1 Tax=methane-oxidizing endosymbiont of Gigantopelta aegis TaxID=2794938 RepID=UPI0018DE2E03|nr:TonB-dependent receptor [methane-oxidizing endosymbiont of Gigantopelta aegis]
MKLKFAIASLLAVPAMSYAEEQQLPTIVVEGVYERPGTFSTAPDSSVLKDTASLLERVPGAAVNRNGPLTGIASYRGMYGPRININVGGANFKEVGPNSMDPPLSHVPAPLVKSLKVHRGIAPVSSGIDTIGGAMKVEYQKGRFAEDDNIEFSGLASMGYSSVQEGKVGVLMGAVANKNHKVYLSGIEEKGHDYKIDGDLRQKPTQYDRNSFSTGYAYRREGHEAEINYNNIDTGASGTPALPMDVVYVRGGLYDARYSWDLGDGYNLKAGLYYQKMRHWMDNYTLRTGSMLMANRTTVEAGGLDIAFTMPFMSGDLTLGINGDQSNHDADVSGSMLNGMMAFQTTGFSNVERDRYSFFAEWDGEVARDLSLELGARFTHTWSSSGQVSTNNMMGGLLVNRLALANAFNVADRNKEFTDVDLVSVLRYAMSENLDVEIGFARKNRAPSYQELYNWSVSSATGGLADGNVYVGNLNLDHETAYQFELGVDWHTERAYFSPRVFYHYVDDYIQGLPSTEVNIAADALAIDANVLKFSNIDAQFFGVDLDAGYSLDDNWRIDAGLNYVRGQRVNAPTGDDDLYRISPLNGRTQLTYQNAGWMSSVEGVFVARQGDVAAYNNELKTAGYMLMNVRASYEPVKGLVIGTGVENITDKRYQNHLGGYTLFNRANGRVFSPGRNVYATLSYSW